MGLATEDWMGQTAVGQTARDSGPALHQRRPRSVTHHSDHGSQYTAYGPGLWDPLSPSRGASVDGMVGDCYDNALCESFFATLERELMDRHRFAT